MSIRDARAQLPELITKAQNGDPTILTRNGTPAAAIVPIEDFGALEEAMDLLRPLTPLGDDPRRPDSNIKALSGYTDRHRLRVDRYRVIHDVVDEQVIIRMVAVGHRGDTHRHLGR